MEIRKLSSDEVQTCLDKLHLTGMVDTAESQVLEAKPLYAYRDEAGSHTLNHAAELAKDVAAIANGGGGRLILGLVTQPHATLKADIITGVTSDVPDDVYVSQIEATTKSHIKPSLKVKVEVIEDLLGHCVVVITIPPNPSGRYCFAVLALGEDSKKMKNYFLIPIRVDSDTKYLTYEEIAKLYRKPTPTETALAMIQDQLAELTQAVDAIADTVSPGDAIIQQSPDSRIERVS